MLVRVRLSRAAAAALRGLFPLLVRLPEGCDADLRWKRGRVDEGVLKHNNAGFADQKGGNLESPITTRKTLSCIIQAKATNRLF